MQVWLQTSDVSVHVCNGHLAAHEQATCQVSVFAWVHLHELVLTGEDLCEDLHTSSCMAKSLSVAAAAAAAE